MAEQKTKEDMYDTVELPNAVPLFQRTQKGATGVLWLHFGGGPFETKTHKGHVFLGNVGGPAVAVEIERKDGTGPKRMYEIDANRLVEVICALEKAGEPRSPEAEKPKKKPRPEINAPPASFWKKEPKAEKPKAPAALPRPQVCGARVGDADSTVPCGLPLNHEEPCAPKGPLPPNWKRWSFGGSHEKLSDFPGPIVRRYPHPDGKRRRVNVTIGRYPGFPHHHVLMQEEKNPVWDGRTEQGSWTDFREDEEGLGKNFNRKSYSALRAHRWAVLKFLHEFSPETHMLTNQFGEPLGPDGYPMPEELWEEDEG